MAKPVPVLTLWSLVCSVSENPRTAEREGMGVMVPIGDAESFLWRTKGDCCNIMLNRLSRGSRSQEGGCGGQGWRKPE